MLAAMVYIAGILLILLRANRPQHFRFDGLGKSDDCVQWRSQLVTYVGEKVTLSSVRRFRPRARFELLVARTFDLLCHRIKRFGQLGELSRVQSGRPLHPHIPAAVCHRASRFRDAL